MNGISTAVAGDNRKVGTHVADLVAGSIAENTRRSYGTALARIDAWAGGRPLDDHAIAAYFADLHVNGRAPSTISLVAAALRFRASMTNAPDPVGPIAQRTLSGIRRKGRERGRGQAVALKWAKADAAATLAEAEELLGGFRDAALLAIMSDALLCVGELVALDCRDIEPIVMRRVAAVGVDSASGHSLRVGSAQSLAAFHTAMSSASISFLRPAKNGPVSRSSRRVISKARCSLNGIAWRRHCRDFPDPDRRRFLQVQAFGANRAAARWVINTAVSTSPAETFFGGSARNSWLGR